MVSPTTYQITIREMAVLDRKKILSASKKKHNTSDKHGADKKQNRQGNDNANYVVERQPETVWVRTCHLYGGVTHVFMKEQSYTILSVLSLPLPYPRRHTLRHGACSHYPCLGQGNNK